VKRRYSVALSEPGEDGAVCADVAQFPEVATFGRDRAHALQMAADAVYVAVCERLNLGMPVPLSDAEAGDELAVAVDVPPKRHRRPPAHCAAINTDTLVVFPGVDEFLPERVLVRVLHRLRIDPEQIQEWFGFDDDEMALLLDALRDDDPAR
jgi:predicted RNase H-like HicB family nuclease